MVTQRRQAAHDTGEDIWNRVAEAGENGLPRAEAMGRNTPAQFEYGKTWIRDHQCANKKTGFVLVHGRYIATNDVDMSKLYASLRLHSLEKQAARIYKCCLAHLPPEAQNDLAVMLLVKTCKDVLAALKFLEDAGFSPQAATHTTETKAKAKASAASGRGRKTPGSAGRS
ncbi:hypothetical protein ACFVY4_34105 [Streptomyces sp. NPDC058299]|uniref:hypothetical protein n=1 Tax=Streptomyces sp. NPDC058299 TaxID=3346435 RepID=UPI0036E22EA5